MFAWIKKILGREKVGNSSPAAPDPLDQLTISSLWNDFERRTWHYKSYASTLSKANPRLLNWIGSIDYSGYTRERCLRYLISHYTDGDENRILLRLTDWVPEVQELARRWTLDNFQALSFESIEKNHRLILHLLRKKWLVGDPALRRIQDVLLSKASFFSGREFYHVNALLRRHIFMLSLNGDQLLRPVLLDDPDPTNRCVLLRHPACDPLTPEEMARLKKDKSVFVRRQFMYSLMKKGKGPSKEELIDMALDKHAGIRDFGKYYLRTNYDIDAYEIYRTKTGEEFYYIADFARKEDALHFKEGMKVPNKRVRINCLRALAKTDRSELRNLDLVALALDNRKLRKIIRENAPALLSIQELQELKNAFVKRSSMGLTHYLRMVERKSYWEFLDESLTELLMDPREDLIRYVENVVRRRTAVYERISADLRNRIAERVHQLGKLEDERLKRLQEWLNFIVDSAP